MSDPLEASKNGLRAIVDAINSDLDAYAAGLDEAATNSKIYSQFCAIAKLLGPAISSHLRARALSHVPDAGLENLPDTHWGFETPPAVREYNATVLSRLVKDLEPAIAGAFPHDERSVNLIVYDLSFADPPIALPAIAKKPRGAGGRPYRSTRDAARQLFFEVVVFEAARENRPEIDVCLELSKTIVTRDIWKLLVREQKRKGIDVSIIQANGRTAGGTPHPKRASLGPELNELIRN